MVYSIMGGSSPLFEKYQDIESYGRYPFTLVTEGGHKTYLGTFTNRDDLRDKKRQIEKALVTHKKLKAQAAQK